MTMLKPAGRKRVRSIIVNHVHTFGDVLAMFNALTNLKRIIVFHEVQGTRPSVQKEREKLLPFAGAFGSWKLESATVCVYHRYPAATDPPTFGLLCEEIEAKLRKDANGRVGVSYGE